MKNILFELYTVFFKIGAFTIGGGYAMLPIIQDEIVKKRQWATEEEIINYYAIGQSTPGIIAINTSTFIGFKKKGILGGIIATLGMVTPSLIIIMTIAAFFNTFNQNIYIQKAFVGIRTAVVVLIINSIIKMSKKTLLNKKLIIYAILSFLSVVLLKLSPIIIILTSAILGIIISLLKYKLRGEKNK